MYSMNDKVSIRQIKILTILDIFSAGILIMPRIMVERGQQDGWLLVIGGTFMALIYGFIIGRLIQRMGDENFVTFTEKVLTKPISILINTFMLILLLGLASLEVRIFGEVSKQLLLPKTPLEILIMSMLLITAYTARKGYECRGRLGEILIFFALIPIVLVLVFALGTNAKIAHLAPFFQLSWKDFLTGSFRFSLSYLGVGLVLFCNHLVHSPKRLAKGIQRSIMIVGVLSVFTIMATITVLGVNSTKMNIWPVLSLMQGVNVSGSFIERQEALMVVFWIISVFSLLSGYIYFSSLILTTMIGSREQSYLVFPLLPFIYIGSLLAGNIIQLYEVYKWSYTYLSGVFLIVIPVVVLFIAKVRKVGVALDKKK